MNTISELAVVDNLKYLANIVQENLKYDVEGSELEQWGTIITVMVHLDKELTSYYVSPGIN